MTRAHSRRGIALIISLAMLAVLALLATSFVQLTKTDRIGASNYALQVRAQQIAAGGIHRAVGELHDTVYLRPYTDFSKETWIYRQPGGKLPGYWPVVELATATSPSMPYDVDGDGVLENGTGGTSTDDLIHGRVVSGMIDDIAPDVQTSKGLAGGKNWGSAEEYNGNCYALKIRDASSKININSPQANLATLLDELGLAIEADVSGYDPVKGRGSSIVAFRDAQPGKRLREIAQLESLLGATDTRYLAEFLTCHGWRDETTIKPSPSVDPAVMPTMVLEPRYPININTVPKPILRTLLSGLYGYRRQFVETADVYYGKATVVDEKKLTIPITFAEAGTIADEIITARVAKPFMTFEQFHGFVESLPSKHVDLAGLSTHQLGVLIANFNPNTLLMRFNPNSPRARTVSKVDLVRYSIEICFGTNGIFEIESLGRITALGGQVVAEAREFAVVQVMEVFAHTTQKEFEDNRILSSSRTVTFPESIADAKSNSDPSDDLGSPWDGQVEMFSPPVKGTSTWFAPYTDTLAAAKGASTAPIWDSDAKEEDISVLEGSDLMPDGVLSTRSAKEELGYSSTGNLPKENGTLEFWVKLAGGSGAGSNESLFYSVLVTKTTSTGKEGVGNKLLRWGDKLYNTRFYWGNPHYATSPYALAMSEARHDISDWKDHEWHHVAIVYTNAVAQKMYVDGKLATDTMTVASGSMSVKLGSNAPIDHFTVGGYEYYSPEDVEIYQRGTVIHKGINERFSNTTISTFKVETSTKIYTGSSVPPPDRYDTSPSAASEWFGEFDLKLGYRIRIGALAWTRYQPKSWMSSTYNATATSPDTYVEMSYRFDSAGWTVIPTAPSSGGDGSGHLVGSHTINASGSGFTGIQYRIRFKNPGGITPLNVSPVVDTVKIYVQIPTRVHMWRRR